MDSKALKLLAQCPVCLEVKRDVPIYQCANGHIICGPCKDRAEIGHQCPTGRCPFDTPPRRNRQVERIIEEADLEFSCRHASEGCEFIDGRKELRQHEENECDYRPVKCVFLNCGQVIKARDMPKHLLQAHLSCKYSPNGCEFTGTRGHLLWHEDECVFRTVQCPDGQCELTVKVIEVLDHIRAKHKNAVWVSGAGNAEDSMLGGGGGPNSIVRIGGSSSDTENELASRRSAHLLVPNLFSSSSSANNTPASTGSRQRINSNSRRHTTTINLPSNLTSSSSRSSSSNNNDQVFESNNSSSTDKILTCRWNICDLKYRRHWGLVIHEQDDLLFFGQLQKGSDGLFYIWLQTLGSKRVASNYKVDLEIKGNDTEVRHRCKVFPIDLSKEEVRWDSQCFQASERLLRQCVEKKAGSPRQHRQQQHLQQLFETRDKQDAAGAESTTPLFFEAKFTLNISRLRHRAEVDSANNCATQ